MHDFLRKADASRNANNLTAKYRSLSIRFLPLLGDLGRSPRLGAGVRRAPTSHSRFNSSGKDFSVILIACK